jgi:hypothetical protein
MTYHAGLKLVMEYVFRMTDVSCGKCLLSGDNVGNCCRFDPGQIRNTRRRTKGKKAVRFGFLVHIGILRSLEVRWLLKFCRKILKELNGCQETIAIATPNNNYTLPGHIFQKLLLCKKPNRDTYRIGLRAKYYRMENGR